ncbi:hypothetical protein [Bdellovibrio bacteriovorus]|uniref:hypothetical protein n=1 Tax=Bdellovibrio bacteriovorus TaxID=959 RepID=UPI0035A5A866
MKSLLSLIAFLSLSMFTEAAIASPGNTGGQGALENVFPLSEEAMSLPDFAERLQTPQGDVENKTYTCRAWTTCPNGGRISCWSQGYRCYSSVTPGYRVYCSATSRSGYTRYWVYYCY